MSVEATFHKNALIKNLVILFDFFCAVESIYSFFQTDRFFWFNLIVFVGRYWKTTTLYSANLDTFYLVYRFWDI